MRACTLATVFLALVAPGCVSSALHEALAPSTWVPPGEVRATRAPGGGYHVRATFPECPPRVWRVDRGGWNEAELPPDSPPPAGGLLPLEPPADPQGLWLVVDGERRVPLYGVCGRVPPPAWRTGLAWSLTPVTAAVDLATLPLQPLGLLAIWAIFGV